MQNVFKRVGARKLLVKITRQIADAGRGHLAYEGLAITIHDELLGEMDFLKERDRAREYTDIE